MRKKGAIVMACILLVAAFMPVAGTVENYSSFPEHQSCVQNESAELPTWELGNYWTYVMNISYEATGASADMTFHNVTFEVVDIDEQRYTLAFNGTVTGAVVLAGIIEGNLQNTVIEGNAYVRKSDLALERVFDVHMEGEIKRQMVTNSFWADIEMNQNVTPVVSPYDFPIELFETWTIPETTFWLHIEAEISLAIPYTVYYDFPVYIEPHDMVCVGREVITVPAAQYNAFAVSGYDGPHQYQFWYHPSVGNVVKSTHRNIRMWYNESTYWDIEELSTELVETNAFLHNEPPYVPSNPHPENGSTGVATDADLSWTGGDPDGDAVVYDVYFGTAYPLPQVSEGQSSTTYDPGVLEPNTTYYWRIDAHDSHGASTTGPDWVFVTETEENNPPTIPTITGPTSGVAGEEYTYTFVSTDPEGDNVYYEIDWGDNSSLEVEGPYASGEEVTLTHTWDAQGTYYIRALAKDVHEAQSEWGTLKVVMPKYLHSPMAVLMERIVRWIAEWFGISFPPALLR